MRCVLDQIGLSLGFFRNFDKRVGETVEGIFVLGLGRFDHQRFMDDEREVVRRRMEVVIHQAFGNIQGADV